MCDYASPIDCIRCEPRQARAFKGVHLLGWGYCGLLFAHLSVTLSVVCKDV